MTTVPTVQDVLSLTYDSGCITEVRTVGRRDSIRVGDRIRVKPRRKGGRDGYVSHVRSIVDEPGYGICLEVFDSKGALRTLPLSRFDRIHQTKNGEPL